MEPIEKIAVIALVILIFTAGLVGVVSWTESNKETKNETCVDCKVSARSVIVTDEPKQAEVINQW